MKQQVTVQVCFVKVALLLTNLNMTQVKEWGFTEKEKIWTEQTATSSSMATQKNRESSLEITSRIQIESNEHSS